MISIKPEGFQQQLADLTELEQRQIPYATATALTRTAQGLMDRLRDEMRVVFDRPTPYTLNSLRMVPARKDRLEARVWFKDEADGAQPASVWIAPEVHGGPRRNKPAELQLRAKGILPEGKYVVPGAGADLDRYGNIRRGQVTRALSGIRGFSQAGYNANATDSRRSRAKGNARRYFVMTRKGKPIGIAERTGRGRDAVSIIMAFVSRPSYRSRLSFFEIAQQYADENLPREFEVAMRGVAARFAARR